MNRKSIYWGIFFSIILASLIFILGSDRKDFKDKPSSVYQVYLDGKVLGVIKDEEKLYDYIDKEQKNIRKEYNVKKVYAPIGLETTKLVTYDGEVDSVESIYEKIKDVEPFTVKGYEITINHSDTEAEKINVLKEEDFKEAVDTTIKAFVDEETYAKYLNSTQEKIVTTGTNIENVSVKENITIKEKYISTEDKIYTNANELSRYVLFGTDEEQGVHIVEPGETISKIAEKYELNTKELLIVNPDLISENALLFPGQEVNVGLVNPIISVVVESTVVEDQEVKFEREVKYEYKYPQGTSFISTPGQNGISRATYYKETINGVDTQVVPKNDPVVIVPVVNEVTIKGGLLHQYVDGTSSDEWAWPTLQPYYLTGRFGWRTDPVFGGREYHRGVDISGTGYGSPIYAAKDGTITRMTHVWDMGNHIYIDHHDGYVTIYMHMSDFMEGLRVGSEVKKGDQIGYMGSSGKSTGTHLDFRVILNGTYLDPLTLYN